MQRRARLLQRLAVIAVLVSLLSHMVRAQDASLLRDGGFEGQYTNRGRADLTIPADWSIWIGESPHTEDWMNLPPVAFPHNGPNPAPHGGARSLNLNKGYATFTAAVYQQVSVPEGSNVTASAWAFLRTCDIPDGADNCTSSGDSNAFTRIGVDPNGGTNPFDADVVWSANAAPHESWGQMTVSATATGGTVTLFLYSTQQWPSELNGVYWDDAALSVGGTGGVAASAPGAATPQPTTASVAPPVNAQGERADGSIVHIVEAGDTLDSIAFAYGVTRADLLALNNIADPRIIQIGQEIIVKAAPTPTPTNTREGATEEPTPDPNATPVPPAYIRDAAPAPVISSASGDVVYPIDVTDGSASICVLLFEDGNQNRIQDVGEDSLVGGEILLTSGAPSGAHTTDDSSDPFCFEGLAAGSYLVAAAAPDGYGLTTPDQLRVQADAGAQVVVAFGAAEGVEPVEPPPTDSSGNVAPAQDDADTRATGSPAGDNIGLVVFGAAGLVLVAGLGVSLLLRRR
ncbi:MAG: LysM peptidoglycan-binding domain-containing protein [Anaerolineae bacterium]|nr:LysM peptidoglycan-binding domain-containing protein [Anaerolineae bacterium]